MLGGQEAGMLGGFGSLGAGLRLEAEKTIAKRLRFFTFLRPYPVKCEAYLTGVNEKLKRKLSAPPPASPERLAMAGRSAVNAVNR